MQWNKNNYSSDVLTLTDINKQLHASNEIKTTYAHTYVFSRDPC